MWAGTYERSYPRTRVLIEGLRALGADVVECQRPVWERQEHKTGGFLRPVPLARAGLGYLAGWARVAGVAGRGPRPAAGGGRGYGGGWARVAGVAARGPRPDAVVAGYPAQPDALPAWLVARGRGALLVADMMISAADTLAGDRGIAGRRLGALLAGADRLALRLADIVLCDTHAHALFFHERFGTPWAKLVVAPVGAEPGAFPASPAPSGPPRALFYGKLSPLHGLATVLEAARMPGVPPVRLIGDGQLGDWLGEQLRRDPPPGARWDRWVPYERLGEEVSAAAICLGVFGTSAKAARVVPNKVWQAMAAGRPVISADTPGIREAITDGVSGLLVPAGDAPALADAMRRLASDRDLRARMGEAARAAYVEKGAPPAAAAPLHEALRARIAGRR